MAAKPAGAKEAALRELREKNAAAEASPKGKKKGKPKPKAKD